MQISEPKTSDPLHSSWTRKASRTFSSDIFAGSPKQYTVRPPITNEYDQDGLGIRIHTYRWQEYLDIPSGNKLMHC